MTYVGLSFSRYSLQAAAICSLLFAQGCGGTFNAAPVSGTITLNGQPLKDATVTFTPQGGGNESPASSGRTDSSGNYSLTMISDNSTGALIGKHSVRVSRNVESQSDVMTPEEIRDSTLPDHDFAFEVKSGSNQANFNLGKASGNGKP